MGRFRQVSARTSFRQSLGRARQLSYRLDRQRNYVGKGMIGVPAFDVQIHFVEARSKIQLWDVTIEALVAVPHIDDRFAVELKLLVSTQN